MRYSLAVLGLLACGAIATAQRLTGAVWYTTDSAKRYTGGYANTYGGDTYSRNLYTTLNQEVGHGGLLNSGNTTTIPTRIDVDLSLPGTYRFQMYCNGESSGVTPFWGINLFFDGNDLNPGISAWNVVNTSGFQSVNAVGTPTLNPLTMGLVQPSSGGSNSLQFVSWGDARQIVLTDYKTWSTTHYNVDRVDNFSDVGGLGNGAKDQVIELTLQVTPVPEPGTLLAVGAPLLLALRRKLRLGKREVTGQVVSK